MLEKIVRGVDQVCVAWNSALPWMLRRPVAFRLGLFGDGAHHVFRELDGSDLNIAHLDSPCFGLGIQDALDVDAQLFRSDSISSSSC